MPPGPVLPMRHSGRASTLAQLFVVNTCSSPAHAHAQQGVATSLHCTGAVGCQRDSCMRCSGLLASEDGGRSIAPSESGMPSWASPLRSPPGLPRPPSVIAATTMDAESMPAPPSPRSQVSAGPGGKSGTVRHGPTISWSDLLDPIATASRKLDVMPPPEPSMVGEGSMEGGVSQRGASRDGFAVRVDLQALAAAASQSGGASVHGSAVAADCDTSIYSNPLATEASSTAGGDPMQPEAEDDGGGSEGSGSVIVHDSLDHPGEDAKAGPFAAPLAEGEEGDALAGKEGAVKRTPSVSFDTSGERRGLHRHKSSNYSRLLDYRFDEWCAPRCTCCMLRCTCLVACYTHAAARASELSAAVLVGSLNCCQLQAPGVCRSSEHS